MLMVKTKIMPSQLHGIGLFADEDIPKGSVIWQFNPKIDLVLSKEEVEALPPAARHQMMHYGFSTGNGKIVLVCDDNRFINWSDHPNVMDQDDIESPSLAARDIAKGEELTSDYCFDHQVRKLA